MARDWAMNNNRSMNNNRAMHDRPMNNRAMNNRAMNWPVNNRSVNHRSVGNRSVRWPWMTLAVLLGRGHGGRCESEHRGETKYPAHRTPCVHNPRHRILRHRILRRRPPVATYSDRPEQRNLPPV